MTNIIKNKFALIIVVGLIVAIGGYFLLQGGNQTPTPQVQQAFTLPTPETELSAQQSVREIEIIATDYAFAPSSLALKAGERIRVNFRNDGKAIHDWVIEGAGIGSQIIKGGANEAVEFTVPASGNYTYFCSVPGHRERGMVGTLKVE